MSYSPISFQTALSAIGAIAFVVTAMSGKPKQQRIVGQIQKTSDHTLTVTGEGAGRNVTLFVPDSAPIHLCDERLTFEEVESGRKAAVQYVKVKGRLTATDLDIFPEFTDFSPPASAGEATS